MGCFSRHRCEMDQGAESKICVIFLVRRATSAMMLVKTDTKREDMHREVKVA